MTGAGAAFSLRRYLLVGILVPVVMFIALDTFSLYRQTLAAVTTAYDRTLLASAKSIGEHIDAQGHDEMAKLSAVVPYSALEAFEADNRSRMVYRISQVDGRVVDGFADLRMWRGTIPQRGPYAALVDFYDDTFRGDPVRVAVLLQPVASEQGRAMAVVQVAETLELRRALARQILVDTLWRQALLVGVIALVVLLVVQRATRPVRELSATLQARSDGDLTPLPANQAPRELLPLLEATNSIMSRLHYLLEHQKRFVRDAAHQLRTPLAVLKVQVQSARRGDVEPQQALREINDTVNQATVLANQMLSLAKVAQLREQPVPMAVDWALVLREVALDLAPLIADKELDFDIDTQSAPMQTHDWMLRELSRNLLHNAICHTPAGGRLSVRLLCDARFAALVVSDSGPGISEELRNRLFQPFSAGQTRSGSGLGLAICHEIVLALGGDIQLDNRIEHGQLQGLDATARLPLAMVDNAS
ncbi:MAG: sensor histidine kinase N-terminal domain-containing protein [Rhodoferax sp.]|nr:sensor histidine kinase N-terminal domain-containing protein [Rhodoferax sp.]